MFNREQNTTSISGSGTLGAGLIFSSRGRYSSMVGSLILKLFGDSLKQTKQLNRKNELINSIQQSTPYTNNFNRCGILNHPNKFL